MLVESCAAPSAKKKTKSAQNISRTVCDIVNILEMCKLVMLRSEQFQMNVIRSVTNT